MTDKPKMSDPADAAWRERHADALAHGWRERFRTSSGFDVDPLYTPAALEREQWSFERDVGYPGEPPYTRGFTPAATAPSSGRWRCTRASARPKTRTSATAT